ncbi:MAG TPA: DNA-binding response regulator [Rhodobiaceae bacterium]|nr:DNA-binding response regulator [Rhodobiaceae bacterium]
MAVKQKILLAGDDEALAKLLDEQLALHEEFELSHVETAAAALSTGGKGYDLILLDAGLPDQGGRETCEMIRENNIAAPVIILTGVANEADAILALDAGANDYVIKPFRFGTLLARMRAQLRSHEQAETAELKIGAYIFRPSLKTLEPRDGSAKIRLTEKETNILKFLYRAGGSAVARDTLLHEVWGYNAQVSTHTLETHIYRLRRKIEADPSEATLLLTLEGGYALAQ